MRHMCMQFMQNIIQKQVNYRIGENIQATRNDMQPSEENMS